MDIKAEIRASFSPMNAVAIQDGSSSPLIFGLMFLLTFHLTPDRRTSGRGRRLGTGMPASATQAGRLQYPSGTSLAATALPARSRQLGT
jgi:hypothetical protein